MTDAKAATKLCRDCRWVRRDYFPVPWRPYEYATCTAEQAHPADTQRLVSGQASRQTTLCTVARGGLGMCGPEGRYWTPRNRWRAALRSLAS